MGEMKIVVGYDGSADSKKALQLAATVAKGLAAEIVLLTVLDPGKLIDGDMYNIEKARAAFRYEYGEKLEKAKAKMAELGVAASTVVLEGNPAETILDYVHKEGAFMIVVGTRGLGGFKRLMLGSLAQALVTYADVPVLVAK